jgi:RNA polymerase sigma factor (sigma-70 family)
MFQSNGRENRTRVPGRPPMRFVKQIETLFRTGTAGGLSDGQLLERFLERRGEDAEAAFAALVDRHGAMVLRVCRQILRGEEDAEDAAQATFLVLARRAGTIGRRKSVGCWLHGVAIRVAAKARIAATRRRTHERRGGEMRVAGHVIDADVGAIENHDDWAAVHDELGSLPQSFREPLILCYLDGLTQEQAAAQLRCPLGTIQSRLARGRAKLKVRLEKRGVGLSTVFVGANHVALQSCPAPQEWAEATVRMATQFSQGRIPAVGGPGAASVILAEEVVRGLVLAKMKVAVAMILSVALLVSSAAAWAIHDREPNASPVAFNLQLAAAKARAPLANEKAPPEDNTRTIRGIVRDEQGRPVAKAWIGCGIRIGAGAGKGQLAMVPLDRKRSAANRTDSDGRFSIDASLSPWRGNDIRFGSADLSQQALAVLHGDDPDRPIEITLLPVRQVRARVIVKSRVEGFEDVEWRLFALEPPAWNLDRPSAIGATNWAGWDWGSRSDPDKTGAAGEIRQLELSVPRGTYELNFYSDALDRVVDIALPGGNGPVELPDIELEPRAWFRMLGKPAAEIEAVDLDDKPTKLGDYRGKVVVLVFWSTVGERMSQLIARLASIQKRFADQPLAILALHDSSPPSRTDLRDALKPLRKQTDGAIPIRFLLDRAPSARAVGTTWVEFGLGRTAEIYENRTNDTMFVVARDGNLAFVTGHSCRDDRLFAVAKDRHFVLSDEFNSDEPRLKTEWQVGSLLVALEDEFGVPSSRLPRPKRGDVPTRAPRERTVFKGTIVDRDGKPVARAKVAGRTDGEWTMSVETGANGQFALTMETPLYTVDIKVEAEGFASRCFMLDVRDDFKAERPGRLLVERSGVIDEPLVLGPRR